MDIEKYLDRIKYKGQLSPTLKVLNTLQEQHLLNIPFENLDIHYGNEITLNLYKIYHKIIIKKRGGFCYELNGLFLELLKNIGFNAKMVSARVYNSKKTAFGGEFDHMVIIVKIGYKNYLVDVGFGAFISHSLPLEINKTHHDLRGDFIIEKYEDDYYMVSKWIDGKKQPQYIFSDTERQLEDFTNMCHYHQTSNDSNFTQKKLISRPLKNGRITLSENNLKITEDGEITTKQRLNNQNDYITCLLKYFNIQANDI